MANNDFPSKDIKKLIELWQQEECLCNISLEGYHKKVLGAQWLSGIVLDSRPKGRGFKPHQCLCVVVLEQDTFILA